MPDKSLMHIVGGPILGQIHYWNWTASRKKIGDFAIFENSYTV